MKSIMQADGIYCYKCGKPATDKHHIFGGQPNRDHSEADGLYVRLCHECHMKIHFDRDQSGTLMNDLRRAGQSKYEETHSREEFRARYGRSWL